MVIIQQDILTQRLAYLGGQTGKGGQSERKERTQLLIRNTVCWFVFLFIFMLIENVDSSATGMYALRSLCSSLSCAHIHSLR